MPIPSTHLASLSDASHPHPLLIDEDEQGAEAQTQAEDEFETQESYTDLRLRWGVDNSSDDDSFAPPHPSIGPSQPASPSGKRKGKAKAEQAPAVHLPSGMMNDLKSITELRSKGESRRFFDEVGYVFEGLEKSEAIGVRRSRCVFILSRSARSCHDSLAGDT